MLILEILEILVVFELTAMILKGFEQFLVFFRLNVV